MKMYTAQTCGELLARGTFEREEQLRTVREIIADVRARGDKAVFELEEKFDGARLTAENFRVSEEEIAAAYREVSPELLGSLRRAIDNIYEYHSRDGRKDNVRTDGLGRTTGYVVRPVESAGIYVPGGTAPLSSSVCM